MRGVPERHPAVVHRLSQPVVDRYAQLSGDHNPLHVDPDYAAGTPFERTIAHGPIALQAFFEALMLWLGADRLPEGTGVQAVFRNPVMSDATVSCHLVELEAEGDLATVRAECRTGEDAVALAVTATVPVPAGSDARRSLLGD